MAWTALREAEISLKELRVYFALAEMKSRRCGCTDDDPPPEFTPLEVRRLVGGAGGEREAVQKLLAVGLLREVSKTSIEFATDPGELRFEPKTLDATLDLIPNNDRRVPVPRRIVRLIAGGAAARSSPPFSATSSAASSTNAACATPRAASRPPGSRRSLASPSAASTSSAGTSWRWAGSSRRRPPSER